MTRLKVPRAQPTEHDLEATVWDDFTMMRISGQEKRRQNRLSSPAFLTSLGILFREHKAGAHLVVTHGGRTVDFWPGTGKWIDRDTKWYGRGVRNLIKHLEENEKHAKINRHKANSWRPLLNSISPTRKLEIADVMAIRILRISGKKLNEIAMLYKISQSQISRICNYTEWGWLK